MEELSVGSRLKGLGLRSAKTGNDISSLMYGKVPPQARDLEEAVLGAILIDKDALSEVIEILKPETFYDPNHGLIYKAICRLFERPEPVDLLTVAEELRKSNELEQVGGPFYLAELTNKVASSANVEFHSRIIIQKFIQRELIRTSTQIINDAYEDSTDVFDLLDKAEANLFAITDTNLRRGSGDMRKLVTDAIMEIGEIRNKELGLTGIPSGYTALDRITSGWQKTELIITAARPAMGKTAFILNMARNAAVDNGIPVAIFSLEMSAVQLVKRLISAECEIEGDKIKNGTLTEHEWAELNRRVEKLAESPIYIDDSPAINIFELRAKCRRLVSAYGVKMVFIDYLQLMSGTSADGRGFNREQEISNISRSLKSIAKELEMPVIALSQLSRAVESRTDKKPQLSDLRESGSIEQDADMVLFLFRPEYYGFTQDAEGNSTHGVSEVIIAKHRNGPTGTVPLRFINKFAKFTDINPFDDLHEYQPVQKDNSGNNFITMPSKASEEGHNNDDEIFDKF